MNRGDVGSFCPAAPVCASPETMRTDAGVPDGDVESLHEMRNSAIAPPATTARMLDVNTQGEMREFVLTLETLEGCATRLQMFGEPGDHNNVPRSTTHATVK